LSCDRDDPQPPRPGEGRPHRRRSHPQGISPPERHPRADPEREPRQRPDPGGVGHPADQQVRRGLPRQAILRRLRGHGRDRAARHRARQAAVRRRARQRPAARRQPGQHGRLLRRLPAGRPGHGHGPRPGRPPDPRQPGELQRQALRDPLLRRRPGDRADRLRRRPEAGRGGPPEDADGGL